MRIRVALLLALAIPAIHAEQMDCGKPVDVKVGPPPGSTNVTFSGSIGETVYIRLQLISGDPGFNLKVPVVMTDPFGNPRTSRPLDQTAAGATPIDLAGQASGEGYYGLEFDLFTDGTYTLQLAGTTATASANLHVTLARINRPCAANTTLSCGRSTAGAISTAIPGQIDTFQYAVQTGDVVSFRLLRVSNSGQPDTSTGFFYAIYANDPNQGNRPYVINNVLPTGATDGNKRLSFAQIYGHYEWTATVTGTVTIVVFEASGTRGGSYYVSATKLNGGCGGATLSCTNPAVDSVLTNPLTYGFYTLAAGGGDVYQFRTARSDTSGTFAPSAEIYNSLGVKVGTISPGGATGHAASATNITFPKSDNYTIIVSGPADGSLGGYSLSALRLNRPCDGAQALTCSSLVDGSISGLVRNQVYSLTASAKDSYLVRLLRPNSNSLFIPRIDIYDQTGAPVQFLNTNDLARTTFTVPADGVYTLVATDSYDGAQSGAYSLSLLRLNRPCNATPLSCGAPAPGSLTRSLSSGVYTYTAAASESFSVRMLPGTGSPQTALEVYDALGNPAGQGLSGSFAGVDVVKPVAGTYTVIATDSSKTPSASSFTLDLLRTTNACSVPAAQGATINGAVSSTAPFLSYRIAASSGDMLSLRSSSSTANFSAQMELYDPDGQRLDSGVFSLSRKAAATGTYTVILGAAAARTAGGYSFAWQLLNQPAGALPLACGGSTTGALSASNQFRYYTLNADAGDILRLIFSRISDNFSPQIELFDPAGARLSNSSDVTQKVSAAGSYTLVVSPSTSLTETGAFTVAFQRPNNPCSPVSLTCGQTALRQVNLPGQLDTYSFSATGGDQTTINLTSRSGAYSPFVEMYNPAGTLLVTSSNGTLRRVLPADGKYTLLVRDRSALNLGSYRVSLQDDTNNCPVTDTEAPSITLLRPTGGEVVAGGSTFRIQWLSDDNVGVTTHDLALSTDAGKTFATPFASLSGNAQTYDWSLPGDIAPTRTAVLRITATDAAGNAKSAVSDLLTLIGSGFTPNSSATYTYDGLNRLIQVSLSDGTSIQYIWDAAGNLAVITVTQQ